MADDPQQSKSAQKKAAAAAKKAQRKAEAAQRVQAEQDAAAARRASDSAQGAYGDKLMLTGMDTGAYTRGKAGKAGVRQHELAENVKFSLVSDLNSQSASASGDNNAANMVTVRARVHSKRSAGNLCFLVLRQQLHTVQAVLAVGKTISKQMVAYAAALPRESIVDVTAEVRAAPEPVEGTTQHDIELHVHQIFMRCPAVPDLPINITDAGRPESAFVEQEAQLAELDAKIAAAGDDKEKVAALTAEKDSMSKFVRVHRSTRLDNRVLDLRVPAHIATFRIQSWVQRLFREFLYGKGFTEIHTPKIIGGASEGGAEVFKIDYFGKDAFLAQSPQLYKQMALVCDWLPGVFEIAPVFRAENSNTHRHLTEFMGMDLEMTIKEHYHEAVDTIDAVFNHIFTGLNENCKAELASVNEQYPFEPLKWTYPALRLTFPEGIQLLRDAGETLGDYDDLNTQQEKKLGEIVREKYDTDFYILDKFPLHIRPFYTMPDSQNPLLSNSYDFMLRGQEILSGAQRVHDPELLTQRAKEKGVDLAGIQAYVDSFKFGAEPHAGGGIGLERVVFLFLGLTDIRQSSMFPRDPQRTSP